MRLAYAEARRGRGRTRPNPMVGAVLVKDGALLATGYHKRAGLAHAEVDAIAKLDRAETQGAELYVTLEPCDHVGRTGPCTEAILAAGITKVFVGAKDPNPIVDGRGIDKLRRAGVEVVTGVLEAECAALNEAYAHYIVTRRPYVIAKVAASLDGKVATREGESRWITSEASRAAGHELRAECDAIVVGVGTVLADDPRLTCRVKGGRDPIRVIVDTEARTPPTAQVVRLARTSKAPTWIIVGPKAPRRRVTALEKRGAVVLPCKLLRGHVDLGAMLKLLGERELLSVLVEGGPRLLGACFDHGLVDKLHAFLAPMVIGGEGALSAVLGHGVGGIGEAPRLSRLRVERLDEDVHIMGYTR